MIDLMLDLIFKAGLLVVAGFAVYVSFILAASHSATLQRGMMYINWTRAFRSPQNLKNLRALGIHTHTRSVHCETEDGITLHGYHMIPVEHSKAVSKLLADTHAQGKGSNRAGKRQSVDAYFEEALRSAPYVVLYMHGIGLDRSFHYRMDTLRALCGQFGAHCFAFDYRGFGDCGGGESLGELGTRLDARAMSAYLQTVLQRSGALLGGTPPTPGAAAGADRGSASSSLQAGGPKLVLYGHSMGAAISSFLLADDHCATRAAFHGLVLKGAFSSADESMRHSLLTRPLRLVTPLFECVGVCVGVCVCVCVYACL